jgi:hypothetical protein
LTQRIDSTATVLGVCGDPVVSRALVLILRGFDYDARLVSISSLSDCESLEGIRLLLLTPMPELSSERCKTLIASLADTGDTRRLPLPTLELVGASVEAQGGGAVEGSEYFVPWPCRTKALARRIQSILHSHRREDPS